MEKYVKLNLPAPRPKYAKGSNSGGNVQPGSSADSEDWRQEVEIGTNHQGTQTTQTAKSGLTFDNFKLFLLKIETILQRLKSVQLKYNMLKRKLFL